MESFLIHLTNLEIARPRAKLKKAKKSEELAEDKSRRIQLRVEYHGLSKMIPISKMLMKRLMILMMIIIKNSM